MSIVTTEWLAEHLHDDHLRIVDIRGKVLPATEPPPHYFNKREAYDEAHIPGAVFIDWVHEFNDPDDPNFAQVGKPDRYKAAMEAAGIGDNTFVVAYDDGIGMFAARLWFTLNYYGHDKVAVLNGGWSKWTAEGRPTTAEVPPIPSVTFTPKPNPALKRNADDVLAAIESDSVIVDVRSAIEFNGEASRTARKGHIPGALNNGRVTFTDENGWLLEPQQIRKVFESKGISDDAPEVVFYCNGGVSASLSLLAYTLAGFENGAMYDGSWKDWSLDASRPVE